MEAAKEIKMFPATTHEIENKKKGFVPIYRSVKEHWLWKASRKKSKFEAWIDLLLLANHDPEKEPFGNDLIVLKEGQILTSQDRLSKEWFWDRSAVRGFLAQLEKDKMISIKVTTKFTIITICKYAIYKDIRPTKQQQINNRSTTKQHIQPLEPLEESNSTPPKAWRYSNNGFFDRQIEANQNKEGIDEYKELVEFLHGANRASLIFDNVLSLNKQISFKDFMILREKAKTCPRTIGEVLMSMENKVNLKKEYKNVYLTVSNWLENDFTKKK